MIRVAITGAMGKMGREVVKAVSATSGMEIVAAIDPAHVGERIDDGAGAGIPITSDLARAIEDTEPDVLVDFTHPSVVEQNLRTALSMGVHCVVGTTGLTEAKLRELIELGLDGTCLFVAPNFAIGAVLMMQFAAQAARFMPHAEIIELHHDKKADAPSGTAIRTASLIASARGDAPPTPGAETELPGASGARGADVEGVHVHSVRLPGLVAHQEVVFGGQGQTLTLRHDSIDRTSFMPGIILAISQVTDREGLIIGLENLL